MFATDLIALCIAGYMLVALTAMWLIRNRLPRPQVLSIDTTSLPPEKEALA